jgi:outer membrane protein
MSPRLLAALLLLPAPALAATAKPAVSARLTPTTGPVLVQPGPAKTGAPTEPVADGAGLHFTLKQAEDYALANHPQIAAAQLNAEAVRQQIREARSQFFPQIYAESDSVDVPRPEGERLAASSTLSNSSIYTRQSDGVTVSQLLFDFGHTYDLTERATFRAHAAEDRANVTRSVIVLQVDRAYFDLLRAQAVQRVADETIQARQLAFNQVSVLAKNQLRSSLDTSFAQVNLSQAKLLQIEAQNGIGTAEAQLSTALGFPDLQHFVLADVPPDLSEGRPPEALIQEAMTRRPDLQALHGDQEAAQRLAQAQGAAQLPKVTALGAAGVTPDGSEKYFTRNYYLGGINVEVPLLTGGNLDARTQEARLLADAAMKNFVDAQNTVSRDVRLAWLNLNTARERIGVTDEMVLAASDEVRLATARYQLGTSSIVELTQAQLNSTDAEIQNATARYDYDGALALLRFTVGTNL